MEKIIWSEQFSVGIYQIDEEHKKIIELINSLLSAKSVEVDSELISETLMKMTQYASKHFKTEENLMSEYGYPEFEEHKEQHKEYIKKTVFFSFGTMSYKQEIPMEVLEYLKSWWTNHILIADSRYRTFFNERGVH